ncbi:transcription factor AP-1-like [Silurus meridionalis]|nr:transcription factor AP-1-like [Silurus meridionalis]
MDGVFYNEALDGVLNHPHHHLHHHHHNGETGGHGYGAMTRNLNLNLSLNVNLSAADAHEALALTSPDLHVLRLTSPELERLIMQSCGGSNASTPVAGGPPRVFPAPKRGAEEHDAFAPEEFRCHQRMNGDPDEDVPPPPPVAHGTSHSFEEQLSQTWGDTAISAYPDAPPCAHLPQFACAPALKDESQKVPETPPLSPIDMEDQERIKAERKRMRNRVAASKCRKRKLERLARLEERVSRLSGENGELRGAADTLRDQVAQLRHQLLDHIKSGCKLLSQQLQTVTEF